MVAFQTLVLPESSDEDIVTCNSAQRGLSPPQGFSWLESSSSKPALPVDPEGAVKTAYYRTGTGPLGSRCHEFYGFAACTVGKGQKGHTFRALNFGDHKITCPECYESVISGMAEEVEKDMTGKVAVYEAAGIHLGETKHFEVSPSQEPSEEKIFLQVGGQTRFDHETGHFARTGSYVKEVSKADIVADGAENLRRSFSAALKKMFQGMGDYAFWVNLHLERKKHKDGTRCEKKYCKRKHVWTFGPHFHLVGYGMAVDPQLFGEISGWHYSQILTNPGQQRSVFDTVRYCLSHCANFERTEENGRKRLARAFSYVGLFSSRYSGQIVTGRHEEEEVCYNKKCLGPVNEFGIKGHPEAQRGDRGLELEDGERIEPDYQDDHGPVVHVVEERAYFIRDYGEKVRKHSDGTVCFDGKCHQGHRIAREFHIPRIIPDDVARFIDDRKEGVLRPSLSVVRLHPADYSSYESPELRPLNGVIGHIADYEGSSHAISSRGGDS